MPQPDVHRFYESSRAATKIVVVDLGFLGDTLHLIPALWEIKRHYPLATLDVLTSPLGAEVLHLAPCVDRAWPLELHPDKRTWREHAQVVGALRRARFDVAFNFGGNDRTIILTGLTGARWRVAHAAGRRHFWNRWLVPHWVPRQDPDLPVLEQRRLVLAACGCALAPARYDLKVPEADRQWAAPLVPSGALTSPSTPPIPSRNGRSNTTPSNWRPSGATGPACAWWLRPARETASANASANWPPA